MFSCQLSLAIPPWVDAVGTSESWGVNRHTARCTSRDLALYTGVWLRANETEISTSLWAIQRRSQEFDFGGGYKLHDIEFVLGQGDKTTTKSLR